MTVCSKSECNEMLAGIFQRPKGSGIPINVCAQLARCLYGKCITSEQFNEAMQWIETEK